MKVKIKSFNGELPNCFSEGVEYIVDNTDDLLGGWVYADDGEAHFILIEDCSYLNGGSWKVVE